MTPIGSDYQDMFDEVAISWQAGQVADLDTALKRLDRSIDEKIRTALARARQDARGLRSRAGAARSRRPCVLANSTPIHDG